MQSEASSPEAYLAELDGGRCETVAALRALILANLPEGYEEAIQYGMLAYRVPSKTYVSKNGIPLVYVALASQKQYISLYLLAGCVMEGDTEWFRKAFEAAGKKLNMGKGCVRFRKLDDLALDAVATAIRKVPVDSLVNAARQGELC